jgi:hypothetical protein
MSKWYAKMTVAIMILFGYKAWAGPNECPNSIFSVVASIIYVEPATDLSVRGSPIKLKAGDCLLSGQEINLVDDKNNLGIQRVEVFYGGDRKVLINDKNRAYYFRVPEGLPAYSKVWQELIAKTFRLPSVNALPEFHKLTATQRGESDEGVGESKVQIALRPIESLRKLPTQSLTEDATFVGSWQHGKAPHVCQSLTSNGEVISTIKAATNWCAVSLGSKYSMRVVIRDSLDNQYGWNIDHVAWSDIPGPEAISLPFKELSLADRAAWGMWLWQNAPNKWRLQALSMIYDGAKVSWLAGYFLQTILEEKPLKRPDAVRD